MKIKIILCGIMMAAVMLTGCTKAPQHPLQEIETEEAQIDENPFFAVNADSGEVVDEDPIAPEVTDELFEEINQSLQPIFGILAAEKLDLGDPGFMYSDGKNEG